MPTCLLTRLHWARLSQRLRKLTCSRVRSPSLCAGRISSRINSEFSPRVQTRSTPTLSSSESIGPAHATIERSRDLNGVRPSQGPCVPPRRTSTHPRSATPSASVSAKMPNSVQALRYAIHRYSELFNIAGERERRACRSLALGRTPRCDSDMVAQFARTHQVVLKAAVTKVPARVSREVEMSVPAALALSPFTCFFPPFKVYKTSGKTLRYLGYGDAAKG